MKDNHAANPTPHPATAEMELVTFLRILWTNRIFLIVTIFGAMFLAGAASYLKEKTFQARAKIVVEVPKRRETTQIFGDPLTVLGYESLLNSDESFQRVLDTLKKLYAIMTELEGKGTTLEKFREIPPRDLWKYVKIDAREADLLFRLSDRDLTGLLQYEDEDFENLEFETFKESFASKTTIEKETGVEVVYSPIIDMTAESNTPEKAALLANLWALTFVADIRGSLSVSSATIVEEIISVESDTRQELEEATEQLKNFEEEVGIERLKQELEAKNISLYGLTIQTQTETDPEDKNKKIETESVQASDTFSEALMPQRAAIKKTIRTTEEQLALLEAYLEPLESEGIWIADQPLPVDQPEKVLQQQIEKAQKSLTELEKQATLAEETQPIATLRQDIENLQQQLDRHQETYRALPASAKTDSTTAETLLTKINEMTGQKAELDQALSKQEKIVQQINGQSGRLAALQARLNYIQLTAKYQGSESANMTLDWLEQDTQLLDDQMKDLASQLMKVESQLTLSEENKKQVLESQKKYFQDKISALEKKKENLRKQAKTAMRSNVLLADQVEKASASFHILQRNYMQARQKRDKLRMQWQENQALLRGLDQQVRTLQDEIHSLSQKISTAEAKLRNLEKKRDTFIAALENISEQVSEAVTARNRRVADVRVQSRAIAPDQKTAPRRSLWVITAGALVFLFDLGFLLLRRLFELAPEPV